MGERKWQESRTDRGPHPEGGNVHGSALDGPFCSSCRECRKAELLPKSGEVRSGRLSLVARDGRVPSDWRRLGLGRPHRASLSILGTSLPPGGRCGPRGERAPGGGSSVGQSTSTLRCTSTPAALPTLLGVSTKIPPCLWKKRLSSYPKR